MEEQQLVVHIDAPGTVHHDKRYREICASLSTFEPATVTRLGRLSRCSDTRWAKYSHRAEDDHGVTFPSLNHGRKKPLKNTITPFAPNSAAPSHGSGSSQRPRVSPAEQSGVQVPATVLRKRPRSVSALFHSTTVIAPDAYLKPQRPSPTPISSQSFIGESEFPIDEHIELNSVASDGHGRVSKRMKSMLSGTPCASGDSRLDRTHAFVGRQPVEGKSDQVTLLPAEMEEGASGNGTSTDKSTLSPSQPVRRTFYSSHREGASEKFPVTSDAYVVDLTSPLHSVTLSRENIMSSPTRTEVVPSTSPRGKSTRLTKVAHSRHPKQSESMFKVVQTAQAPEASTGFDKRTDVTPNGLSAVVQLLPLTKHFKPRQAVGDLKGSTRGYWELVVSTASPNGMPCPCSRVHETDVTGHERVVKENHSIVDSLPPEPSQQNYVCWTEQELSDFWRGLTAFIQSGRAGSGVEAVKESHRTAPITPDAQGDTNRWRIRVFCWSEVLSHVWLILWVLSNKTTAEVAMRWMDGKGRTRVQMTADAFQGTEVLKSL